MDVTSYPSGILTFLFTDIQGSTPLWERDPAGMRAALELHNSALHAAIKGHDGQVFKIIGDEFQAVFVDPLQAVEAAAAGQRALALLSWGRVGPLRVRMGIHTGHAVSDGEDYEVSHTFNRTARIMSAGHGGQILLSVDVVDQLDGILPQDLSLQDMGRQRMKGMTLREHLFQIMIADLALDFPPLKTEETRPHDPPDETDSAAAVEAPLQISLLGEFSLRQSERAISLPTATHQSLLAYLVVRAQRVHSRQQLAFQFWPDSSEAQARTNLRKALYTLRHTLPHADRLLTADRQTVQWCLDAPCVVDLWDFETAVTRAQETDSVRDQQTSLQQAVSAYHGEFMPGHYDDWLLAVRENLRHQYLASLEKLLMLYEELQQYSAAIGLARKMLQADPLHEAACRRLMLLQSLDGNTAGALRTYHACSTRLQQELGVDPSPATQELYEQLLQVPAAPLPLAPARLPLVARAQAWHALQSMWKQCHHGQPGVVLLSGEAGIGKTRLAEELLDWVGRQGFVVITAVCYPSEQQLAYAPVAKWLRSESLQPLFRRLDKRYLVECSRLLPEINNQHPNLPAPTPLSESWQRQHLFSALAQTLLQVRQPMLLFIDDLQWCDQDTLDWLLFLLRHDPKSRFLLMSTVRSEEITPDHALIEWQPQLARDGKLTKISLKPLDAANSAQLAGHVLKQELDDLQAQRLHAETEGNPLFVVEMARVGLSAQTSSSKSSALPPKVQAVIETRLASLSPSAADLAQLAATIGSSFTYELLNQACIHGEDTVIRSLDELWQRRIVREQGVSAYDFTHDKIRQGAYGSLSPARRRRVHQQVWLAMELLHADNLDPVSGQIAAHCEAAGQYEDAVAYYQQAVKVAQAVYANGDEEKYLQRIVGLFSKAKTKPEQQIEIYQQLGDVLNRTGRYEEAEEAMQTAIALATDPWRISHLYRSLAGVLELQRQFDQAHLALDKAEAAVELVPKTPAERWWREWIAINAERLSLYYFANKIREMVATSDKIRPIVETYGSRLQKVDFYQDLVLIGVRQERSIVSDEVVTYAKTAYEMVETTDDLPLVAWSRVVLAFAYLWHGWHGDLDEAEAHFLAVLEMAEEMGNVVLRTRCYTYLGVLYRLRGDHDRVADLVLQTMASAEEGNLQEYIAAAEANLAWLKWREGDLSATQAHGQKALDIWKTLPVVLPFWWAAIWPLIDVALTQNEIAEAVEYAGSLLLPDKSRLPNELTAVLQQAINAYANNQPETTRTCLQTALQQARELNQL